MNSQVNSRKPRKLNRDQVLADLERGRSQASIAKAQHVSKAAISKFVSRIKRYVQSTEELQEIRGDVLTILSTLSFSSQEKLLRYLEEKLDNRDFMDGLTVNQICNMIRGIGLNSAVLIDKARLVEGHTNLNIGIAGLITHSHKSGVFDENTGEFKASVVGLKPTSRLQHEDYSKHKKHNDLAPHETRMDSDDGEGTSDNGSSVN